MGTKPLLTLICVLIILITVCTAENKPCAFKKYIAGYVCVCNATYCDTLDDQLLHPSDPDEIYVITTSERGLRYSREIGRWSEKGPIVVKDYEQHEHIEFELIRNVLAGVANIPHLFSTKANVHVNESITYQTIMGFGGAIPGAVAYNLEAIPQSLGQMLLESYYSDKTGIGYNLLRMCIGAADFDLSAWAYNETPENDVELSNFTRLDPRTLQVVDKIKKIKSIVETREKRKLKIKAAAWGSPKWMRTRPDAWGGPGVIKAEYYQAWADYHLRFLRLMKKEANIDIWALSSGNEPSNSLIGWSPTTWISVGWWPDRMAKFVADYFGPTLRKSEFKDIVILVGDDQRFLMPWFYKSMNRSRPDAFDYIDGIAVHSYFDKTVPAFFLDATKEAFPNQFIMNTESSVGDFRYSPRGPLLGSWPRAMDYIKLYMDGLHHNLTGWIDWNLILNERGGPNYVGNPVDAPIILNITTGEAYKQPMFYVIGHFSKFVPEGSVRINVESDWGKVHSIAFRRPDKTIAVILFNEFPNNVEVTITDAKRGHKVLHLPPSSISTVIYK